MYQEVKWKLGMFYDLFRYDIPRYIQNIYRFRKTLWNARTYDYTGVLYSIRDNLEGMEKSILNGYHTTKEKDAAQVRTAKLLLDRILGHTEQYQFDDVKMTFEDIPNSKFKGCKFTLTPLHSEAPRDSKLQRKILKEKEEQDFELLMKLMSKHLRKWWS